MAYRNTPEEEPQSIEDRERRIADIDERVAELNNDFAGRLMSDEARDEWNELNAERDAHATTAKELRARNERLRQVYQSNPNATERAEAPSAPAFIKSRGTDIYELSRIRSESSSQEEYRENLHDNAKRAIERAHFPRHSGGKEQVQERVTELLARVDDEHGTLAERLLVTGSPVYDRAFGKMLSRGGYGLTSEEQRAMSLGTNSEGGFAVPFQLDPTVVLTTDGSVSPLRQISRVEQIVGKEWQGITSSGISVSRSGEGEEASGNEFSIEQPTVRPTRVIADVRFSVEIDQDWSQMRTEISRLLADAKDREEDSSFISGDGSGDNPSGVVSTLSSSSAVDMGTAGSLDVEDLYNLEAELPVRFRSRGQFLANKGTYNRVRDLSTGSDGGELWVRLGAAQPSELLGYPAHEASNMDGIGSSGNRVLLFGDFSEFLIVDRLGMTVEVNPHITGSNGRWTGQRSIVAVWRNSSRVLVDNAFRVLADVGSGS